MRFSRLALSLALFSLVVVSISAAAEQWPQWRGPQGQGHAAAKNLPTEWSESKNVAWRTPLPGRGWSSPVVGGKHVWMTTAIDTPISAEEKKKRLEGNTGNQPLSVAGKLSLRAVCVDLESGKLLRDIELMSEDNPQPVHTLNSFASPSPVLEDGKLYCHFGAYGTACLDTASGNVDWTQRTLKINHENGPGSTPIVWKDKLIFHCDGSDVQYIAALDKRTGEVAWKTGRSGKMHADPQTKKSYGTPLIVEIDGRPNLISPASDWLYSYDPANGQELWKVAYGGLGFSIVPRPVVGHGMLYFSTSFMKAEILAVRYDGRGEKKEPHIAWRYSKQAPQQPSPVLVGDELYIVSDGGVATCLDAKTGKAHWSERLKGNYSASPLYADGKLYFSSREGETTVVAPGTTFTRLAVNTLDGQHMASLAAVDEALLVRTDKALYRIQKSK